MGYEVNVLFDVRNGDLVPDHPLFYAGIEHVYKACVRGSVIVSIITLGYFYNETYEACLFFQDSGSKVVWRDGDLNATIHQGLQAAQKHLDCSK